MSMSMSMSPLARLGRRLPLGSAFRRPRPLAVAHGRFDANRHVVSGSCEGRSHRRPVDPALPNLIDPRNARPRCYSSSPIAWNDHRHPPKNERRRHKLRIGFASLSNSLPFEQPESSSDRGSKQRVGDTELDPHAAIMLTSLRGGVTGFDCPAPPLIESNKRLVTTAESATCWRANRQSEAQISRAFDQAWEALLEEDDAEATRVLKGEEGGGCVVTMTCRLGYRSAVVLSEEDVKDAKDSTDNNTDCMEREGKFEGDARVGVLYAGKTAREDDDPATSQPAVVLVHNLSKEYVLHSLRSSPLVQRYKLDKENSDGGPKKNIQLVSLAHNPETQISAYLIANHHRRADGDDSTTLLSRAHDHMKRSLTSSFVGYEIAVREGLIDGYGVDSNGLSLPKSHDMHFGWRDVLECAAEAYLEVRGDDETLGRASLRAVRLPGNLLETLGLDVAREIHSYLEGGPSSEEGLASFADDRTDALVRQKQRLRKLRNVLPESLDVCVTRPLTAYPYGGTGWGPDPSPGLAESSGAPPSLLKGRRGDESGSDGKNIDATHPIRMLDYRIEEGLGQESALVWSNHHFARYGPRPAAYQPVLNAVLSHFDADAILQASLERELTVEERETLDGCRLLRDMLHDLDASLDTMRSFAAYEEYLMNKAVPLIHGSFEELDEDSAGMLQLFFRAHGMAVRMAVARWTRELLVAGWRRVLTEDGGFVSEKDRDRERAAAKVWTDLGFGEFAGGYDVPEDVTLQEFALRRLLGEDAVRSLVVGCSRPEHVLEAMRAADSSESDGGS